MVGSYASYSVCLYICDLTITHLVKNFESPFGLRFTRYHWYWIAHHQTDQPQPLSSSSVKVRAVLEQAIHTVTKLSMQQHKIIHAFAWRFNEYVLHNISCTKLCIVFAINCKKYLFNYLLDWQLRAIHFCRIFFFFSQKHLPIDIFIVLFNHTPKEKI